jgi:hypothetical protein
MRIRFLVASLALSLAGCTSSAGSPSSGTASAGDTAISILGTPFLIAFKIPVCIVSAAIAAPLAGAAALVPDGRETQQTLGADLAENCGPPYVLSP